MIVFPAVAYIAFRRVRSAVAGDTISEPRATPFGISALLLLCVLVIYAAGAYATRPFDGVAPFMNMFLPSMLVTEIYLRRGTAYGYAVAFFWGVIVLACIAAFIRYWLTYLASMI